MDKPVGSVIYCQLLNERGGIEADLTVCRLAKDRFYIITGSGFGVHDSDWIRRHLPRDGSVTLREITSEKAVLNICGPQARAVLERAGVEGVGANHFPFATSKTITIGAASVLALRIGYVGEQGWELHMPYEVLPQVYETLWQAGQDFGIANVGYRAIDTLRVEKGYLYWSADISPDDTPLEAGLGFRVAFDKGGFIGRDALLAQKEAGVSRRLSCFTLEQPVAVYGGEAILRGGKVLGRTTSGNFGHTVGKPIVYGYLPVAELAHSDFEIEAFGERVPATRHDGPLYDPKMERLKA